MEIAVRQSNTGSRQTPSKHRCPQCRLEALVLRERYTSPPAWGAPVVTEYYDCDYCDARYSYSPADNRWKVIYQ